MLFSLHSDKGTKVVAKRVDDFRERTQPQLGQVHDPIKETMRVPPDHSYGILFKPDEFGAGDLMHGRAEGNYLRGCDRDRGLVAAIRQQLKKANYHNFNDLRAAFDHYDEVDRFHYFNPPTIAALQVEIAVEVKISQLPVLTVDPNVHTVHTGAFLTVSLTTLNNTRQCFYQSKTVDSFLPVNVLTTHKV